MNNATQKQRKFSLNIGPELHQRLKLLAAQEQRKMGEMGEEALDHYITRQENGSPTGRNREE